MTSYLLGMQPPPGVLQAQDAQSLPQRVPPEQTNT
jgi:hypothetical protein